jgi:hypothetical protein
MSTRSRFPLTICASVLIVLATPALAFGASTSTTTTSPASTPPRQIIVSGFSEKGDGIDNGVSRVYSTNWDNVVATTSSLLLVYRDPAAKVSVSYDFAPVAGQSFAVGTYDNVQRTASRSAGFPGIDITGPGRPSGCPRVTGSFRIWDIAANASGQITRLDLTFVEHCGAGKPSNFGEVLINDAPHVGALVASSVRMTFPDQTPTLPYVVTNPTARSQSISLWQSATTVSHFTLTPVSPRCASEVAAKSSCTYLVRLVPPRPGMYFATVLVASGTSVLHLALSGPAGGA